MKPLPSTATPYIYPMTPIKLAWVRELGEKVKTLKWPEDRVEWQKACDDFEALTGREMLVGDLYGWPDGPEEFLEELKRL